MKKIAGFIMIALGIIFSFQVVRGIFDFLLMDKSSTAEATGHALGYLVYHLLLAVAIFFLIRVGLKFFKRSPS